MAKQKASNVFVYILNRNSNILGSRIRIRSTLKAETVEAHNMPVAMEIYNWSCGGTPRSRGRIFPDSHHWIWIRINAAIRTRELPYYSVAGRRANNYAPPF
jgi:hypothetical protein